MLCVTAGSASFKREFTRSPTLPNRVVTSPRHRGQGLGDALVAEALRRMDALWPGLPIRIGAQAHLVGYYGKHGFVVDSDEYDEDGIPHREMQRMPPSRPSPASGERSGASPAGSVE